MDEASASKHEAFQIRMRPIHLETLKSQFSYFGYAHHLLIWLADRVKIATNQERLIAVKVPKPKKVAPPKLDSRGEVRLRQSSARANPPPPEAPTR